MTALKKGLNNLNLHLQLMHNLVGTWLQFGHSKGSISQKHVLLYEIHGHQLLPVSDKIQTCSISANVLQHFGLARF